MRPAVSGFHHNGHKKYKDEKVSRVQPHPQMAGKEAEKRRNKCRSDIGAGHLKAHQGLRIPDAEISRRLMKEARVNRSAAKTDQDNTGKRRINSEGQKNAERAESGKSLSNSYHITVSEVIGNKTGKKTSKGDPQVEICRPFGSLRLGYATDKNKIAAGPKPCGRLQGAITEE